MNRRNFVKRTGRYTLFAGLVAVVGISIFNNHNEKCEVNSFCQDCSKFSSCDLPQALEQKSSEKK